MEPEGVVHYKSHDSVIHHHYHHLLITKDLKAINTDKMHVQNSQHNSDNTKKYTGIKRKYKNI